MAVTTGYREGFHNIVDKVLDGFLTVMPIDEARRALVKVLADHGATVFESRREAQLAAERYYARRSSALVKNHFYLTDDDGGAA